MIDKNKQQLDISQKKPVDNKQINNQLHNVL